MKIYSLIVLVCVFILTGCGGGSGTQDISVVSTGDDAPDQPVTLRLDGETMVISDWETSGSVVDKLSAIAKTLTESLSDITFDVDEVVSVSSPTGIGTRAFNVGRYTVRLRWKNSYVGGCIKRNGSHLVLQIQDRWNGYKNLCDIHLMSWWQNGPQFGAYNSLGTSKFCRTSRGTFTAVRQAIRDVIAKSTPLPSWAVSSIAYSSAIICFGSLAFLAI